jgi:RimJ/RimL family protein N-acetyltransferase
MRTARLSLDPIGPHDRGTVVRMQTDPANFDYDKPNSVDDAHDQYERWSAHWLAHGWGYWLVRITATGALAGIGGARSTDLDGGPAINIYYRFLPAARGKGYASELLTATVEFITRVGPDQPLVIITDTDNEPSISLAERSGFTQYKVGEHRGRRSRFFRHTG